MGFPSIDLRTSPAHQNPIELSGDGKDLQPFLKIHPPDIASRTPPLLTFKRKREVEIPWDEILGDDVNLESIGAFREYFEESWGLDLKQGWTNPAFNLLKDMNPTTKVFYVLPAARCSFFPARAPGDPAPPKIAEGFLIQHCTTGRVYRLIGRGEALKEDNFKSLDSYEKAWKEQIAGVEMVFPDVEDTKQSFMVFEEIDLRPVVIQRKYKELCILRDFAKTVKEKVALVTDKAIARIVEATSDADELERLQRNTLRLEMGVNDALWRIERLASDAARLGYLLITEEGGRKVKLPDQTDKTLDQGKLFTTYTRSARWTEYESAFVPVLKGWWIFKHWEMKENKVPVAKEAVGTDYQPVDTSKDILADKRQKMSGEGWKVYVFEQTSSGLVSTEGEPLRQIMVRCKNDEAFRQHCAVMLPVYEDSLTGERMVAKYAIYKRPLPGTVPTILPRLSLEESLTYRMAWRRTQLGELLNSINLAPDEERKITLIRRFEQETTVSRTSTSIFDISRAETTDLATEMENQTRKEQESSKNLQFSTKVSGSYGPFSAEASASGGTSCSLKDLNQSISKVANKAAKSVNSQNREEVSSTSTARTTVANTDETVATIRNINQGRSLNLMFYRLYNKYEGGLFLEDLRFDVIQSVEVIAGSGVHESRSYTLRELPRLIDEFQADKLPFAYKKDEETYTARLLDSIQTLIEKEYAKPSKELLKLSADAFLLSVERLSLPPRELRVTAEQGNMDDTLEELDRMLKQAVIDKDTAIEPQELLVAAPGLYLDAVVGTLPSTEPYSERMREQTVAQKAAEVALTQADALYRYSLAQQLAHNGGNWIVGIAPYRESNTLVLTLQFPLADGKWDFELDGKKLAEVPQGQIGNGTVNLSWTDHQKWLDDAGLLQHNLELHDRGKGIILRRM